MSSSPTRLYLSRLHWPVTTLGYGRRIGIWFQGCSVRCKGCCSLDTWDADTSHATSVEQVLDWISSKPLADIDGFTVTGGEPFDQSAALKTLLEKLSAMKADDGLKRDVLVYSGFPFAQLLDLHRDVLSLADAVISEPYIRKLPTSPFAGSSNQRYNALTALGRLRRKAIVDRPDEQSLQMHVEHGRVWFIGVPRKTTLELLPSRLAAAGISLGDVSWRT